ncbi:MAG: heavy-metal-associated domain-containing protein [Deltaproteobacteria bacterium]|nr:heavy-metal-associated domain-containing protein [Deltaproteobacteria bacterium]MBW2071956.1 heavy-metal-associated domain-containing protein [Deltaproteobacteria bacterium]
MEKKTFQVPNITCGHCVMSIQRELKEVPGINSVEGNPATRQITVQWQEPATLEKIKETLAEINYPAAE